MTSSDALTFDSVFVIGNLKEQLQGRGNLIQELKETISRLKKKHIKDATAASGLKPRSNTKKDRTLPAKSDKKKVEDHPRNNKFSVKQKNRVDSSISYKCTVINSNSNSICKTCNKCLMSFNHDKCVVKSLKFVKKPPVNKVWRVKQVKQVWKATRKLFTNVGFRWQPTGKKFTLGEKCPLTRFTISKVVPVIQPESARTSEIMITKRLSNTSQKPLTKYQRKNKQEKAISTVTSIITVTQSIDDSVKLSVVHIVLLYLDSGCLKHMTGDRSRLRNFMKEFIGIVRFGNDHFGSIMGYGGYVIGDSVISKHSCYVRDVNGVELIKGNRGTNLYTISVKDMMKSSPICLLSKASKNKSWLWHRRLNHLNFGNINDLARKDLVRGLPRLKFEKDHLCLACQLGKSQKYSHKPTSENTNLEVLNTLHMDLCGPMRVQTINKKKYILVIVDDYSRFTWVKFLRSKDETLKFVIKFLKQIQVGLNKTVIYIRTDNGIEFVNQVLTEYYESVSIFHQKSFPMTSQQNDVVERQNHTLVEVARTMLIFSKALMFLWAKAVATACYTQNRSLIHTRHNKTPYELVHDKKSDLKFLCVFGGLCYPTNDSEDLGKLRPTADIGIFVGYAPSRKGYRIYNKRTRKIMETIHVTFDELTQHMAHVHIRTGPEPILLTSGQISLGLVSNPVPAAPYVPPINKELEILFQPMFDEYFETHSVEQLVPLALATQVLILSAGTPLSTTIDPDAPSTSHSPSSSEVQPPISHQGAAAGPIIKDNPFAQADNDLFEKVFAPELSSAESSSGDVSAAESTHNQVIQPHDHLRKWSKDHPMENIIGNPSRSVSMVTDIN
ncbi:retrovirus-related pol polyprotein from transposon TNT 1-94 [Tanacetum coccineum]